MTLTIYQTVYCYYCDNVIKQELLIYLNDMAICVKCCGTFKVRASMSSAGKRLHKDIKSIKLTKRFRIDEEIST